MTASDRDNIEADAVTVDETRRDTHEALATDYRAGVEAHADGLREDEARRTTNRDHIENELDNSTTPRATTCPPASVTEIRGTEYLNRPVPDTRRRGPPRRT